MSKVIIYGDSRSGNCLKVKWAADISCTEYLWKETSVLDRETRTPHFLKLSPAGQVPIIQLSDGAVLAQSNAILVFLLQQAKSHFIPTDSLDYAKMLQWLFWEQYSHEPVIAVRRFQKFYLNKEDHEINPQLLEKGYATLSLMNDHLHNHRYFIGESISAADIALVAYTRMAGDGGFDLNQFPHVQQWITATETILNLPPYQDTK